jgi:hypothetical protein
MGEAHAGEVLGFRLEQVEIDRALSLKRHGLDGPGFLLAAHGCEVDGAILLGGENLQQRIGSAAGRKCGWDLLHGTAKLYLAKEDQGAQRDPCARRGRPFAWRPVANL